MGKKSLGAKIEGVSEIWKKITIISIHDTLQSQVGRNDNLFYPILRRDENLAEEICERFEEKYNKKLVYNLEEGLCSFMYKK